MKPTLTGLSTMLFLVTSFLGGCVGQAPDAPSVTYVERGVPSGNAISNGPGAGYVATQQVTGGVISNVVTGGFQEPDNNLGTGGVAVVGTGGVVVSSGGVVASGGVTATGGNPSSTARTVTVADFSVTTTSPGGRYSPRNIGAIWVQNSQGQWVKTLEHWAGQRGIYLSKYLAANFVNNVVDAITSATLNNHGTHNVSWNLKDANGADVPDGDYSIVMEMTDKDGAGPNATVTFTLGSQPAMQSFPDSSNFIGMSLNVH